MIGKSPFQLILRDLSQYYRVFIVSSSFTCVHVVCRKGKSSCWEDKWAALQYLLCLLKWTERCYCRISLSTHHSAMQSLGFLGKLDSCHWRKPVKKSLKHLVLFIYWILSDIYFLLHRALDGPFLFSQAFLPFFQNLNFFLQGDRHQRSEGSAEVIPLLLWSLPLPFHLVPGRPLRQLQQRVLWQRQPPCSKVTFLCLNTFLPGYTEGPVLSTFHVSIPPKSIDIFMLKDMYGKREQCFCWFCFVS